VYNYSYTNANATSIMYICGERVFRFYLEKKKKKKKKKKKNDLFVTSPYSYSADSGFC